MAKNIIIIILAILLVAVVVFGLCFVLPQNQAGEQKKELEQKIETSLTYARALDIIMEPSRQQFNLDPQKKFDAAQWLDRLSNISYNTNDATLKSILTKIITSSRDESASATVEFMDYAVKMILETLSK